MREISREFLEAWPLIVATFLAGLYLGWRRANNWRRRKERDRADMVNRANR